jgi:hypothetical protein
MTNLLASYGLDSSAETAGPTQESLLASIVGLDDPTMAQMEYYYDNPDKRPKGATTFIPALDAHFKWMPGYTNLFTGWPGSGKSEFVRQLLLLRAIYADEKTLAFVPEDVPAEAWFDALIHSLTGQNPDSSTYNCLPRLYYKRAMEWVREYFFIVVARKGQAKTPGHILDIFEAGRVKLNIKQFKLDPWNKCDHSGMNAAGGFQPYLVKELGRMTDWSVESQSCLTIVAHPAKRPRVKGEAREVPDSDGVSGGATWDDMSHTINAIYRPNVHNTRNDPAVAFYNHKIKNHRRMGAKPGSIGEGSENPDVLIKFLWESARYTFNGVSPLADPYVQSIYAPELADREPAPTLVRSVNEFPKSMFETEKPGVIMPSTGPDPF